MSKYRILFEKTGPAVFISHLDLVRTMQRVFIRAGLKISHTRGFNPHPHMVFALPLSVGCSSVCELMDFELDEDVSAENIPNQLNRTMPKGIVVKKAYLPERRFRDIAWLTVRGRMEYDSGIPDGCLEKLGSLFSMDELIISKKTKKGLSDADIMPSIRTIDFMETGDGTLALSAVIHAQEPSLNPENLISAIRQKAPEISPDFAAFERVEFRDVEFELFV